MAHVAELPGCITRQPTREQALACLPAAIREHLAWLRSHGEPLSSSGEPMTWEILGESAGYGPFDPGDAAALFPFDRRPVDPTALERFLRLMGYTRADLMALIQDLSDEVLDWQAGVEVWPIRRVLRHIGNAEQWYVSRILPPEALPPEWEHDEEMPVQEFLAMERRTAVERLRQLAEAERTQVFYPQHWTHHPDEPWTAAKMLRRFLEHELEHTGQIRGILTLYRDLRSASVM